MYARLRQQQLERMEPDSEVEQRTRDALHHRNFQHDLRGRLLHDLTTLFLNPTSFAWYLLFILRDQPFISHQKSQEPRMPVLTSKDLSPNLGLRFHISHFNAPQRPPHNRMYFGVLAKQRLNAVRAPVDLKLLKRLSLQSRAS